MGIFHSLIWQGIEINYISRNVSVVVYHLYEMWRSLVSAGRDEVPCDIAVLPLLCF